MSSNECSKSQEIKVNDFFAERRRAERDRDEVVEMNQTYKEEVAALERKLAALKAV